MAYSYKIISEMLPEIHTVGGKVVFSQTYNSFSNALILCFT